MGRHRDFVRGCEGQMVPVLPAGSTAFEEAWARRRSVSQPLLGPLPSQCLVGDTPVLSLRPVWKMACRSTKNHRVCRSHWSLPGIVLNVDKDAYGTEGGDNLSLFSVRRSRANGFMGSLIHLPALSLCRSVTMALCEPVSHL